MCTMGRSTAPLLLRSYDCAAVWAPKIYVDDIKLSSGTVGHITIIPFASFMASIERGRVGVSCLMCSGW